MTHKEKRSLVLSFALGDGCLHYNFRRNRVYGGLTFDHGLKQTDYVTWKANYVSNLFNKELKVRQGHKGKSMQYRIGGRIFKALRKFCYPNDKKTARKMLPFIQDPEFALMVWLMDDGYVEPSITNKICYSARFRLLTFGFDREDQIVIRDWLNKNFNLNVVIKTTFDKKANCTYEYIKFNTPDSLKVWPKMRDFILSFDSMKYKFRHMEKIYQDRIRNSGLN